MSDTTRRSTAAAPTVAVTPGPHGAPGAVVEVAVRVRNVSDTPADLRVHAVGLEPGWAPEPVTLPRVAPQETVGARLPVVLPEGAAAGSYPFLVVVESPTGRTVTDVALTVDGASELVVSVEPADSRGRGRRTVDVVLATTGTAPTQVSLHAAGDGVDVEVPEGVLELAPTGTLRVPAVLRARRRLVGSPRRHTFAVTAVGRAAPQRLTGTFTSHAWLGPGVLRAGALVLVLALWLTGAVAALPRVVSALDARQDTTAGADATPGAEDGTGGTEGGAGGGSGGTGGGSGDDAGDEAAGPAAGTVRASGRVTGEEPAGTTVQVVPTSELWGPGAPTSTSDGTVAAVARTSADLVLGASTPGRVALLAGAATDRLLAATAPAGTTKLLGTSLAVEGTTAASQRQRTTTDSTGTWAFAGLSPTTRYLVTVAKPGYRTVRTVLTGAELAAAPVQTELRAGDGALRGVLTGPSGPVGDVELTITDGTTTVTTRTTTEGAAGRWQVEGLSTPGTYLVTASSPRWGSSSTLVTLPAAGERTVDLGVQPGLASVTGVVVGTDTLGGVGGLGGLTVTATDGSETRTATTLTGDDAGRFVLADLPVPGDWTVTVSGRGYATVTRRLEVPTGGVHGWEVAVTAVGGVVTGTVLDDTGAGVTAAGLVLTDGERTYKSMSSSDGQGSFRLVGVDAGTYVLSAEAFGHHTGYAQVTVTPGGTTTSDLVLAVMPGDGLDATSSVTGRVTDASTGGRVDCTGTGVPCVITVTTTAYSLDGTSRTVTATAAPDEAYVLPAQGEPGLLPGRYTLSISVPGYESATVAVTVPMGTLVEAATVPLTPSPSLVGSVLPRVGVLPSGLCVVARPPGSTTTCDGATATCTGTDARCAEVVQGMYELRRLPAGTWEVTVAGLPDGWVVPDPVRVVLMPGETRRFDTTIERLGIIRVSTLRAGITGAIEVAANATVEAVQVGGTTRRTATSDADGVAEVTGLTSGTYDLVVTAADDPSLHSTIRRQISLNQQLDATVVLATPLSHKAVAVVVQTADDAFRAVPGAQVTVTGITGYSGTTEVRRSQTFTADANGVALVCTTATGDCAGRPSLPLVHGLVTAVATADGYETVRLEDVELAGLDRMVLVPGFQELDASVVLQPAVAALPSTIAFEVLQAPPGTGTLRLTPSATGTPVTGGTRFALTFVDSTLGVENRLRPGTYRMVVRSPGWTAQGGAEVVVDVPYRTSATPQVTELEWVLDRDGAVRVTLAPDAAAPLGDTRVQILRGGDVVAERTVRAAAQVDFPDVPVGDVEVHVVAAGFRTPAPVTTTVTAGQTATPTVALTGLGRITGKVSTLLGPGWTVALPGATVSAEGPAGPTGATTVTRTATTDSTGAYTLTGDLTTEGLWAGTWAMRTAAADHTTDDRTTTVTTGPRTVDVGLSPLGSTLTVRVTDASGQAVSTGLQVRLSYSDHAVTIAPPAVEDGEYVFRDLLPLTYTLWVVPSTTGYTTVSTRVTVGPGQPARVEVPLATPTGSLQGVLTGEQPDGSTVAVQGAQVTVTPVGGGAATTVQTDQAGRYLVSGLGGGPYTVSISWQGTTTTRSVQVVPGQAVVLDVTIAAARHTVTVELTSSLGADLTGGLVTLTSSTGRVLGPQPVARSGSAYVTTFAQVTRGQWTVHATGPAGHLATVTQQVDVQGDRTVPLTLAEVELRLRAGGPASWVDVVVTPAGGTARTVRLLPGASDSVLHLPRAASGPSATLTASASPGSGVQLSHADVPAGTTQLLVTATTYTVSSTTTTAQAPGSVTLGDQVTVTAQVTSGAGTPPGRVQVRRGQQVVGEAPLSGGSASVTVATNGWTTGGTSLEVRYVPDDITWLASSTTVTVQVTNPGGPPNG